MPTEADVANGLVVEWSTDDVTYNTVGYTKDNKLPVPEATVVETSTHASNWRTYAGTMVDGGTLAMVLNYKLTDTQHKALRAAVGDEIYVHVTAPAAITTDNQLQVYGVLVKAGAEDAPIDGIFEGPFEVKVSGEPTWATA